MDNAMVKRGIGAVVLAIIAALLLGYLLKDKSTARQEIVDMKLPGAPEVTIPSLSEPVKKVTNTTATLVNETATTAKTTASNVVASANNTVSNSVKTVADNSKKVISSNQAATQTAANPTSNTQANNPGFSFRPPRKNEEQEIDDNNAPTINTSTTGNSTANNTNQSTPAKNVVVASTPKTVVKKEKKFTPTIENEPKKVVKKATKKVEKKVVKKKQTTQKAKTASTKKTPATQSGKYAIQLLATSSQSRAKTLANTMKSEGYASYITKTMSNNKVLYRVRIGGHNNRKSALNAQASMKRRYQKNSLVQNSLVISQ